MTKPPTSESSAAAGAVLPAWYVINCIGEAILCTGEEDARHEGWNAALTRVRASTRAGAKHSGKRTRFLSCGI